MTAIETVLSKKLLTDGRISIDVRLADSDSASAGLVVRYADESSFLACLLTIRKLRDGEIKSTVSFRRPSRGEPLAYHMAGPVELEAGRWHTLEVSLWGEQFLASVDGAAVTQWPFAELPGTGVGTIVREGNAEFRNLAVDETPSQALCDGSPYRACRDDQGEIVPLWSFGDMMTRPLDWALWMARHATGNVVGRQTGESCYVNYYGYHHDGSVSGNLQYPPNQYNAHLEGLYAGYVYSGKQSYLEAAKELLDWWLDPTHQSPRDWALPGVWPSTIQAAKPTTWKVSVTGDAITMSSLALAGKQLLQWRGLHRETDCLKLAERLAGVLVQTQHVDGNWAFRVDRRTGEEEGRNTAIAAAAVLFLEDMIALFDKQAYRAARDRAWEALLAGPIRDLHWQGGHEDVATHFMATDDYRSCDQTALALHTLIAHAIESDEYLTLALENAEWIVEHFLVDDVMGLPGIQEQIPICMNVMPWNTAWQAMYWMFDLHEATDDARWRDLALRLLAASTYWMDHSGLLRIYIRPIENDYTPGMSHPDGLTDNDPMAEFTEKDVPAVWRTVNTTQWFSNQMLMPAGYLRAIAAIPSLAVAGDHLLSASSPIGPVSYESDMVTYATVEPSIDLLKLRSKPSCVTLNGRDVAEGPNGWRWKEDAHTLSWRHAAGSIRIEQTAI